jgi:hypothetical protein
MKYTFIISLFFFYLFFLFFSLIVWDYIDIGLLNDEDFFKFFFFILSSFFLIYFSLRRYKLIELKVFDLLHLNSQKKKQKDYINFIYLFLLSLLLLAFFSFELKNLIYLDIYHDGFQLVPAMNFSLSNKLWSASFTESGFFANYMPLIYFYFKKKITISSLLFIKYTIAFLNKIILISLAALVTKELNFSNKLKIIFFLLFSLALFNLTKSSYFPTKQFIHLLFILLIYFNLNPGSKLSLVISSFLIGAITFLSLFWWTDIFIFNFLLLILYLFFLFIRKEVSKIAFIFVGFLLSFLTVIFYFPNIEIIPFLENLYYIILKANKYTSIEYPSPLFGQDSRATKTLIFFFYSLFLFVFFLFKKKTYLSNNLKKFLIFLYVGSLVNFAYGLGRSDSAHIIRASGLLMTNFIFYNLYLLFLFFKGIDFFKKKIISNGFILISLLLFIMNIYIMNQKTFVNIFDFNKNLSNFLSLSDDAFLLEKNRNYTKLIKYYDFLLEKDECVQVLTDETIISYIVKRKTCTKFFFYHILLDEKIQRQFIDELKLIKPRFILYKSDLFSPFNFFNRLKLVDEYINTNYEFYEKFDYWTFYKIK